MHFQTKQKTTDDETIREEYISTTVTSFYERDITRDRWSWDHYTNNGLRLEVLDLQ